MTVVGCIECRADLDHCHGTWIAHRDGSGECTVTDCRIEVDGHHIVIDCVEVHVSCAEA